jgi:hypothetical protein
MIISARNFDKHGQIVGFGIHDSVLIGFSYEEGTTLVFRLRRENRGVLRIELAGVGPVGAIGLRFPAIVSEVFAWHPDETPGGAATLRDGAWSVLFGNDIPVSDLPEAIRGARASGVFRYLVTVGCAFGGTMAALCGGIDVFEEP